MQNTEEALSKISQEITWDNWIEDQDGKYLTDENGNYKYWKVTQVLFCKLEWIKKNLSDDDDEHFDTIEQIQDLLTAMSKDDYKNNWKDKLKW